jgi:hypothetical protein
MSTQNDGMMNNAYSCYFFSMITLELEIICKSKLGFDKKKSSSFIIPSQTKILSFDFPF